MTRANKITIVFLLFFTFIQARVLDKDKIILYMPNVGIEDNNLDININIDNSANRDISFFINTNEINTILRKEYINFLNKDIYEQIIPIKKNFLISKENTFILAGAYKDIYDFNYRKITYTSFKSRALKHLNRHSLKYKKYLTNLQKDTSLFPQIYALAVYIPKVYGAINISKDEYRYLIEPDLSIKFNIVLYKFDYYKNKFSLDKEIYVSSKDSMDYKKNFYINTLKNDIKIKNIIKKNFFGILNKSIAPIKNKLEIAMKDKKVKKVKTITPTLKQKNSSISIYGISKTMNLSAKKMQLNRELSFAGVGLYYKRNLGSFHSLFYLQANKMINIKKIDDNMTNGYSVDVGLGIEKKMHLDYNIYLSTGVKLNTESTWTSNTIGEQNILSLWLIDISIEPTIKLEYLINENWGIEIYGGYSLSIFQNRLFTTITRKERDDIKKGYKIFKTDFTNKDNAIIYMGITNNF